MSKKKFKILAMVDHSMTFDPKDELKTIEDYFKEYWSDTDWQFKGLDGDVSGFMDGKADVYVYDFGGVGFMGASGLVESTHNDFMKKIENEPGRLFILWSQFTSDEFWDQAEQEYPELVNLGNVLTYKGGSERDEFQKNISDWLGIKVKEKEFVLKGKLKAPYIVGRKSVTKRGSNAENN